jgi:predicted dienelactone hydrolase
MRAQQHAVHSQGRKLQPMLNRRHLLAAAAALGAPWAYAADANPVGDTWTDPARPGRALPVLLRWPDGHAPCALVIHSHGLGGNREGGDRWGQAWRDAGIAVLHVQHPGSDTTVAREQGLRGVRAAASGDQLRARVADVQFAIDELLRRAAAGQAPFTRVRADAIGASGHSFGAHTVQALAGQRFPVRAEGAADARIRAFIAFSPSIGRGRLSPAEQFALVTRPFLVITGGHDGSPLDKDLSGADRARVYDALPPGRRALLWVGGGDHATFGGNVAMARGAARVLRRDPEAERDEAQHHTLISRASTDWWRAKLLGEPMRAPSGLGPRDYWRAD